MGPKYNITSFFLKNNKYYYYFEKNVYILCLLGLRVEVGGLVSVLVFDQLVGWKKEGSWLISTVEV